MQRILKALLNSISGFKFAFKDEEAFRQELFLAVILCPAAYFLAPSKTDLAIMLMCVFIVLIAELLNSGIEAAIDRIGPEIHPLSKKAKDIGSAAVLLSLFNLVVVWGIIILK